MGTRWVAVGIVAFWAVMMGTLVRRWVLEIRPEHVPGTYQSVLTRERRDHQWRMGIYLPGPEGLKRVGFTQTLFDYRDERFEIKNRTKVHVPVPGVLEKPTAFELNMTTLVSKDYQVEALAIRLHSPVVRAQCHGRMEGGKLVLYPTVDGREREPYELALPSGHVVTQELSPLLSLPRLSVGMKWSSVVIDPQTLEPRRVSLEVLRREELEWEGEMWDTYVVEIRSGLMMRAHAWVSRDGDVLKERTLFGLTFIKERVPEMEEGPGK
ncbi:MAG: hypothetical protein ACOC8A_00805 [bacterium]